MNINLIKTSASLAAVAGILAASGAARAADAVGCETISPALPHVYVAGSSAVKPFIQALSTALKDTEVLVYVSQGSCVGVDDIFNGTALPTGAGLGLTGTQVTDVCTVPAATTATLGFSDVFATSCSGVDKVPDGIGDFQGPVQAMNFVVNIGAGAAIKSISAEAAYLVFGFDPASTDPATTKGYGEGTPWTAKDDIWIRGPGSGTQSMIGAAINVLPASWALNAYVDGAAIKHAVAGGSGEIVTRVGGATNLDTTIGILASNELDDNRATVRGLAFQAYDQSCGYWPDSSSGAKDKLNVRTGKYDIWGPVHMYTAVNNKGKPTDAATADVIAYVNGDKAVTGTDIIALETTKNLVPQCAMQVMRDSEIGAPVSVNPTCTCFYDTARAGNVDNCVACSDSKPCKDKTLTCSFGFCEAI